MDRNSDLDGVQGADEKRTEPYTDTVKGASQSETRQSAKNASSADGSAGGQAGEVGMPVKFKAGTRRKAIEYEKDLIDYWKSNQIFEKSVENRPVNNAYVFYDGPPFISGSPHHGTLLSSIVKDAVPRFHTMKGRRVERVWGWDCHGLPAERYSEKKLGLNSRQDVIDYGLEKYILATRDYMTHTASEWEDVIDRVGRWVEFKGAYKTMDKNYMESIWWAFKALYEKGKIYEGEKVLMYCTLDATPLSKAEVTMDAGAYQDVTDPSVYVKFKLSSEDASLLAWTTTPWTLPGNTAVAVNEAMDYVEVSIGGERLILAEELAQKVLTDEKHQPLDYQVNRKFRGSELIGKQYEPLFDDRGDNAHKVWHADYVSSEEGSGIVHLAPAYGEEDFALAKEKSLPVVHVIDENGLYTETEWKGENVWEINKTIAKTLHERGVVWKIDYIRHSYPHCHRCGTKLMYRAHPSWFMDIDGQREQMLAKNEPINWFPNHVKNGRFAKTVEQAPDWNISRDRFWATAMPVWKGVDGNGETQTKVIGSYAELKELSGQELEDYHRPWIDEVTFEIDGVKYKRIDKVMDSWFEAGSMPFAQYHYPFENTEKFEQNFPGDFIVEYIGQVRAWFYYMHAMSVALFDDNSFKNVIVTGNVAGNDGRKMSKSYGNYTDPNELMDQYSADSLRFLLLSSPLLNGEDFSLQDKEVGDVARKLGMIWNMYDFFTMYAEVDGWEWDPNATSAEKTPGKASSSIGFSATSGLDSPLLTSPYENTSRSASPVRTEIGSSVASGSRSTNPIPSDPLSELTNPLDIWIVSRVHQLTEEVHDHIERYDIPNALEPVLPFLDDASNWYVRRSRRRFWKSKAMHHTGQPAGKAGITDGVSGAGADFSAQMLTGSSETTASSASHGENHPSNPMQGFEGALDSDRDKNDAYRTLHYVLVRLSMVLAPFTPFLAEELYRKLTGGESVHLLDWPDSGNSNKEILIQMERVRRVITIGLSLRAEKGIKVRQPLAQVTLSKLFKDISPELLDIVAEELNVKTVNIDESMVDPEKTFGENWKEENFSQAHKVVLDLVVTPELKREGMVREVIRNVQNVRKQAGLHVDDRIELALSTEDAQLRQAIGEHSDAIQAETLAVGLAEGSQGYSHTSEASIEDAKITIEMQKTPT